MISILVDRFILNLRDHSSTNAGDSTPQIASLRFASSHNAQASGGSAQDVDAVHVTNSLSSRIAQFVEPLGSPVNEFCGEEDPSQLDRQADDGDLAETLGSASHGRGLEIELEGRGCWYVMPNELLL